MMHRHGYGAAERIRMEIRRAWQFRFDWYFKSRNAQEIQKRCDLLVKIVERENEEVRKKELEDARKQASELQPRALDQQLAATMCEDVARAPEPTS
jgi:SLIDE